METAQLSSRRLAELISRFAQCRIAVMGDFFLDKYLDVDPELAEISVETGLTAHQVVKMRCAPGAAGTVVSNISALGAGQLLAIGYVGDDGEAFELRRALTDLGCDTRHLYTHAGRHTPTYLKPRDVRSESLQGEHSRYDTKNRQPTSANVETLLIESLQQVLEEVDAVIFLDQVDERDCGVITQRVREQIAQLALSNPATIFWADSRRQIHQFRHTMIKANQFEAVGEIDPLPGRQVERELLLQAAQKMRETNRAPVIVTCGEAGMIVSDPEWTIVPAVTVTGPIDPTGAGDSTSAGAVMALCAGATLPEAACVGNLVASITIQQVGTTGVACPEQLLSKKEAGPKSQSDHNGASHS